MARPGPNVADILAELMATCIGLGHDAATYGIPRDMAVRDAVEHARRPDGLLDRIIPMVVAAAGGGD